MSLKVDNCQQGQATQGGTLRMWQFFGVKILAPKRNPRPPTDYPKLVWGQSA